jgi:hypothetical protein
MERPYKKEKKTNRSEGKALTLVKSKLSLANKLLIYKTIIKPIWTYGVELWGCASKSNVAIIQRSQSKILRMIADAPWYVPNQTLHDDLKVPFVKEVIKSNSQKHHQKQHIILTHCYIR